MLRCRSSGAERTMRLFAAGDLPDDRSHAMRPRRSSSFIFASTLCAAVIAARPARALTLQQIPGAAKYQGARVPRLIGHPLSDTLLLNKARLTRGQLDSVPNGAPPGTILHQSPKPDTAVAVGTPVNLTFAIPIRDTNAGKPPGLAITTFVGAIVPRLVGLSLEQA